MSCNLDDMTVKCVFHLAVRAIMVYYGEAGHFAMHVGAVVVAAAVVEAPVQFCGLVDAQSVEAEAGLVIVKLVVDLGFRYLK